METCFIHFRSTANQIAFYIARDAVRTPETLARMRELVKEEMELARRMYPIAKRHSVIAYEASNHYYYRPTDLAEKILNCQYLLDHELKETEMDKVRIGLIGCGLFGESHLQAFRAVRSAEIAAVFDTDADRPGPSRRNSRFLGCVNPSRRSVGFPICTPSMSSRRRRLTLSPCCPRSTPVSTFSWKSRLQPTLAMFRMIDAARVGGPLSDGRPAASLRDQYAMLKDEVARGSLGRIVSMHARRNRLKELLPRYGRTHPAVENCIHDIDLMLWYTGDRVRSVRGFGRKAVATKHHDTFWGILEFESGAIGVVETIWLLPKASGIMLDDSFQLIGDRGIGNVRIEPGALTFWRDEGPETPDVGYDPRVGGAHGERYAMSSRISAIASSMVIRQRRSQRSRLSALCVLRLRW